MGSWQCCTVCLKKAVVPIKKCRLQSLMSRRTRGGSPARYSAGVGVGGHGAGVQSHLRVWVLGFDRLCAFVQSISGQSFGFFLLSVFLRLRPGSC